MHPPSPSFQPATSQPPGPIQPLPTAVVHYIAAGEVIDSLGAAVRELVDNALDAGASHLSIALWPEQWRVRVADNGHGITYDDLRRAATPHSTSKIRSQADLDRVQSLGFRGEALHSLAQLGRLEICSRADNDETGWHITYTPEGSPDTIKAVGLAKGTVVTVSDLFLRWPHRRQRSPSRNRQLRLVQQTIYHAALCHPQVTWKIALNDRPWFSLEPGPTARQLVPQMLQAVDLADLAEQPSALLYPDPDHSLAASLYLLIGRPERCHRPRLDWVKIAVNGRLVTVPDLEQTVVQCFRHTLPKDRYPLGFLHLRVDPRHIDWNRSPDKATIYLHQAAFWQQQIRLAIGQLLLQDPAGLAQPERQQRVVQLLKTAEAGAGYRTVAPLSGEGLDGSEALASPTLAPLKAIAQVHNRYILAEHSNGICLIEQHIAHERVLYEQLQQQWQIVPLATPVVLERLTPAQVDHLQRLGLQVETFGNQLWAVRQVPAALAERADLAAALIELSQGGDIATAQVAVACRTAIRNGTPLSLEAMQTLLYQWQRTRQPQTCPHGRPICLTLEETSLARFFRRHWVVGKSHGLEPGSS